MKGMHTNCHTMEKIVGKGNDVTNTMNITITTNTMLHSSVWISTRLLSTRFLHFSSSICMMV